MDDSDRLRGYAADLYRAVLVAGIQTNEDNDEHYLRSVVVPAAKSVVENFIPWFEKLFPSNEHLSLIAEVEQLRIEVLNYRQKHGGK